ncbi:MAG: class II fructose-bisphosphate aldolase, partial [Elusimicrobiota bacterium]|nr:class II fructose-bisphosphate aldolase [Elusimicrobiota bacterium]
MKEYATEKELKDALKEIVGITDGKVKILDEKKLRAELIDELVWNFVFSTDENIRRSIGVILRLIAKNFGIVPATIYDLYRARGAGEFSDLTVPAINIRGMTYDVARAVFRAAKRNNTAAIIFEIARSEIGYTNQPPAEYAGVVLAAAIKENYLYPVFIQGDHYQVNGKKFKEDPDKEVQAVKDLIQKSIDAGFYNIDLDTSTLVDLSKPTVKEQQRTNFEIAANITKFIREIEPKDGGGITVALGGEIGEIGGKNSTEEELRAYLDGYLETVGNIRGITKVAVQTGTTHGGVPLPDGTIAKVKLDFDTLERLGKVAQKEYKLAGCVQHGASTLPAELFDKFPKVQTAEIH